MLTIVRGRTWNFDATIFDVYLGEDNPGNEPTNHTGWTIRSQIRTKVGNKLVANLNVTFPVPTAGTVAIRHDRDFTRSLPVGEYWWDIVATDASGIDHDYIEAEPIAVHDHPTDPSDATFNFVPGGGGVINHTHVISDITGLEDRLPPEGGTISRYLRGDLTWQLLNKAAVGLGNVENTKLSTWTGSSAITTVGTVVAGVWQGTVIAPAYLGTGSGISTKFLRGDGTWQTVSGSIASTDITDSTVIGRALLTAANQSDARTTGLGSGATGDQLFTASTPTAAMEALGQITATSTAQIDSTAYVLGGTPVTGLQNIQLAADTLYELSWYGKFTSNGGSGYLWLNFSSDTDDLGSNAFQQFGRFHTTTANPFFNSVTQIAAAYANLGTQTNKTAHGSIRFKTVLATQLSLGWSQWNSGTIAGTSSLLTSFRIGIRPV